MIFNLIFMVKLMQYRIFQYMAENRFESSGFETIPKKMITFVFRKLVYISDCLSVYPSSQQQQYP